MSNTPISRPPPGPTDITAESATWVVLDDTSPDIEYSGNWVQTTASSQINNVGYFGPTYRNTLHSLTGRGWLSYQFQGTHVRVMGTIINIPANRLGKTECFVDGVSYETSIQADFAANDYPYCDIDDLKDGHHSVNVTFDYPSGRTAWVDKLLYIPSPTMDLSHSLIQVDDQDISIKYDPYWQDQSLTRWTHSNGSRAIIEFAGTSLTWYGLWYPNENKTPLLESRATWTLDDDPEEHVMIIPARPHLDDDPHYNEVMLNLTDLAPTRHTLSITHRSNSTTRPLHLDYLLIQRVPVPDLPSATSSSGPSATKTTRPGGSNSSPGDESHSLSTQAEIGIGIGATVAVLLLAFLALFLYRRYQRQEKQEDDVSVSSHPQMSTVQHYSPAGYAGSFSPVSQPASTPSHEYMVAADPHNVFTNGHIYNDYDGEEPRSPSLTEDLPRYSMYMSHGQPRL